MSDAKAPSHEDRQKMIDKVQKLMAMADSTTHPAEADAFRNKAAEIMARFQVDSADLAGKPTYITKEYGDPNPAKSDQHLVNAVAKFNGMFCLIHSCDPDYSSGKLQFNKILQIIGTYADQVAFEYMMDSVLMQRNTAYCDYADGKSAARIRITEKNREEFFLGFAYGVAAKVKDLLAARDSKIQSWGLVPVKGDVAARTWYEQNVGRLGKGKSSKANYEMAGVQAGQAATLNKGVQSRTQSTRQLA